MGQVMLNSGFSHQIRLYLTGHIIAPSLIREGDNRGNRGDPAFLDRLLGRSAHAKF